MPTDPVQVLTAARCIRMTSWANGTCDGRGRTTHPECAVAALQEAGALMPEEARGRWIHPDKIKEQGKKGWVDFHPEDYCHLCGMRNFSWSTDSDEWNKVDPTRVSILCVYCFTEGWAAVHPAERGGWELRSTRAIYKDERRTALLREVRIALNDHRCGFGVVFGDEDGDAALLTKIDEALPKDDTERPRHG